MSAELDSVAEVAQKFLEAELLFLGGNVFVFLFLGCRYGCGLFSAVEFDRAVIDTDVPCCNSFDLLIVVSYDDEELILGDLVQKVDDLL